MSSSSTLEVERHPAPSASPVEAPLPAVPPAAATEASEPDGTPRHPTAWTCLELLRLLLMGIMVPTLLAIPLAGVGAFAPAMLLGALYAFYLGVQLLKKIAEG